LPTCEQPYPIIMSIPGSTNPLLLFGDATGGALQISRSLRFNSSDSAYLSKVFAVAGNQKIWTWSGWIKRSKLGTEQRFFDARDGGSQQYIKFNSNDALRILDSNGTLITSQVFRDLSAWYHVLIAFDTTQSTASNRIKLYVNGSQVTTFSTESYPTQNSDILFNSACTHSISWSAGTTEWFDGYLTNIHFINGQQLTPSSFTETDATTGQLIPKAYTGSYGTNGFNLLFADNSSNTASTLGKDYSGLGNNWTPNNLSVTAGAGNDSLVDSPTNYGTDTGVGGEVRGNYCTWNPLANSAAQLTYSNGNLDLAQSNAASYALPNSTIGVSSSKWYWETTITSSGSCRTGVLKDGSSLTTFLGNSSTAYGYASGGYKANSNSNSASGYSTYTNGDVIGVALDLDNGKIYFSKNGTWQESGNPATQTNPAYTGLSGTYFASWGKDDYVNTSCSVNFGQRAFAYTAPSGYKALCTQNLPATLVTKSNTVMDVALYTGNGAARSITGLAFNPDFVWIKARSASYDHRLADSVRGVGKELYSNNASAETTNDANGYVSAFNSDGFALQSGIGVNGSGDTYVAWAWDAGTSTVSNTQGSITSQVRANPTAGFSVVTFSTPGSAGDYTIGHGLNVAPSMIIIKERTRTSGWYVYHASVTDTVKKYLILNSTNGLSTDANNIWGSSLPSSTVFGISNANLLAVNQNIVTYCFAPVSGYSSFGSYTGNGSGSDGPFVYTGFRPRFLMVKRTDSTTNWFVLDTARNTYNAVNSYLMPNSSSAEDPNNSTVNTDFLSNGFKLRATTDALNTSSATYIYIAFAESPFNYSRAR